MIELPRLFTRVTGEDTGSWGSGEERSAISVAVEIPGATSPSICDSFVGVIWRVINMPARCPPPPSLNGKPETGNIDVERRRSHQSNAIQTYSIFFHCDSTESRH